ncbi:MAG: sigma-70 family RNA polymerase sigma factor [Clostridia bacterium]|nr:sigma-70 family RNA polymerase sigma factor [Clostridia bacterium]
MPDLDSIFTELFETYHRSLINFCISQGVRADNAEDITSEAFARALAKPDQFLALEPKQQRAWLYSAVAYIMKENNAKTHPVTFSEIENIENYITDNDDLQHFISEGDFDEYAKQVYDELSTDNDRELFKSIFDQKIDYEVLSKKFNVTPGNTRVMVSRLRKKLRVIVNKLLNN